MNTSRLSLNEYKNGILAGNRVILAKAITLMESTLPADYELAGQLLDSLMPHTGHSLRVGITGPPGVGKSTFIEAFGKTIIDAGRKLAVLTIDPTSQISGGSILGDKTRMAELARDTRAFIRPSPSGQTLGGVALHTRETILLCEAAGFDMIVVETVGTGQSEIAVRNMVDLFLLLIQPGSGDELQGIKKGIVEMADAIAITKADGDNQQAARATQADFRHALHLLKEHPSGWQSQVVLSSALQRSGLTEIFDMINTFRDHCLRSGYLQQNRRTQDTAWFREQFQHLLSIDPHRHEQVVAATERLNAMVQSGTVTPRQAAHDLLDTYHAAVRGKN